MLRLSSVAAAKQAVSARTFSSSAARLTKVAVLGAGGQYSNFLNCHTFESANDLLSCLILLFPSRLDTRCDQCGCL